jgi:two-component system phosphate regulon response regulator PhoB
MARILVVEPEDDARATLREALSRRDHAVHVAATADEGAAIWRRRTPDVVIVDVGTAKNEALDPWRTLKKFEPTSASQLVVLTHKGWRATVPEVDLAIEKPFGVAELCDRVDDLLRAHHPASDAPIECGVFRLDRRTGAATVNDEEIDFTPLERKFIVALYDRRPAAMSRGALLHAVWGMNEDLATRTIDTHVRRLRMKLGSASVCLVTVRGGGYAWRAACG